MLPSPRSRGAPRGPPPPLLASSAAPRAAARSRRAPPVDRPRPGPPALVTCERQPLDLGELRLQGRQPGEHRLDRGVLLGVEPGQLLADLPKGFSSARRREAALRSASSRAPKPLERAPRVASSSTSASFASSGRQPGEHRLGRGVLLRVEPGQLLGDLREGVLRRRVEAGLQRVEAGGEAVERAPGSRPSISASFASRGARRAKTVSVVASFWA